MEKREKKIIISSLLSVSILMSLISIYSILNKEEISLTVKGQEQKVSSFKKTVEELLDEQGVKFNSEDKINPGLDTELKDNMKIKVVKVTKNQEEEFEKIPFDTKQVNDSDLVKGKSKVYQEGIEGEKKLVYNLTYHDGKLVKKVLSKEVISKEPTTKIIKNGTKEKVLIASRGANTRGGKHLRVVATAYAGDTITSTGTTPRWGVIAVDPNIIPYGTKVYIPRLGMTFVAEDCGGAIKGNRIDIFMNSEGKASNWGRQSLDVYVY
ncbi:G5 domain-containing protein [Clostridioides difficile]|nr:G5 domain-containing protein [Clostridioides difficile]